MRAATQNLRENEATSFSDFSDNGLQTSLIKYTQMCYSSADGSVYMKYRGSECSFYLLVLRYIQSLFTYVQRKQFLSLVLVIDLLEKFPFIVDTGWRCGVKYHVFCDMFHCIVIMSSVVVYSMFHLRINYKHRWRQPSQCFVSL